MASCPRCRGRSLSPTLLAEGLPAKGCKSCGGVLLDLLSYRAWADQAGIDAAARNESRSSVQSDDTSHAISCPNCSAVMTKVRVSASMDNKLDFCANCDEVWLDGGEWKQLQDLGLRKSLGAVFTEPWQRRVRKEIAEHKREELLRRRFGEDFARLAEIRKLVQEHPQYEHILAWFGDRSDR